MAFTAAQVAQLLRPIHPSRVLKDGKSKSHISQQDVRAHLIRVFGFGNWDLDITGPELVFEQRSVDYETGKEKPGRWDVCYRAKAHLTIRNPQGRAVCQYEGSATATAENQKRGEAHGLALRSAESLALKRAATNLGDQFGLSLYNKGQLAALVKGLVIKFANRGQDPDDIQHDLPKQESLGHHEDIEDALPRNKNGSVSRSRATDEQLEANGSMTRQEVKAHNALVREVLKSEPAEREDLWTQGPPPPEEVAKYASEALTSAQRQRVGKLLAKSGWTAREDQMRAVSTLVGREIAEVTDLTREEAKAVIDVLDILVKAADPAVALTDYLAATKAGDVEEMRRLLKVGEPT